MIDKLRKDIYELADQKRGEFMQGFFKVKDMAKGDMFLGLTVPKCRMIAKKYKDLSAQDIQQILESDIHEERLIALFILVSKSEKADEILRAEIYNFYLANIDYINHWDLVDSSAHKIVGEFLRDKNKKILVNLANSKTWWERRISIIATFQFLIKDRNFDETKKIAGILINDDHDLIQKAVGWMLREGGKRVSQTELEEFLKSKYKSMPRTMLRYSIEKFSEEKRKKYLRGEV